MATTKKPTSNQVKKVPNPSGKGGFQERPQDINRSGTWNPEMVFSFQYRRFMSMTMNELNEWRMQMDMKTVTVVEELAYNAVMRAKGSLPDIKEITDRTEGKAPQTIDLTSGGEKFEPVRVEIVNAPANNPDTK